MTSSERRRCMRLLHQARNGEESACELLTKTIADHFAYMIMRYRSADPAFDGDDLKVQFQLAIWQAIPQVDDRGDPLFHLAWRGQRAVCSLLKVIKRRRYGTDKWVEDFGGERSIGTLPDGWDLPDTRPEADPPAVVLTHEDQDEARQHVAYVMAHVRLTGRQRDVIEWMMADPDTEGRGANLRLAQFIHCSPQMASKYRKAVVSILAGVPDEPQEWFPCLACGLEFRSKSALTQHKRGQSGHRACPGAS